MSDDSCAASGDREHDGKIWKLAREFRRRLSRFGRMLKRVKVQESIFTDGLQEDELQFDHDLASIYDLNTKGRKPDSLTVTVISAANLRDTDGLWNKGDPYCRCYLENQENSTTFQTPVINNNLNPVWNFEHVYTTYPGGALTCKFFDKDWNEDDFIGTVTISEEDIKQGWDTFQDFTLASTGRKTSSPKSTLRLKVHYERGQRKRRPKVPFSWACDHRVRKDWVDLTGEEKQLYLDAVNAVKTTPQKGASDALPGNNIYDAFVLIHEQNTNKEYAHQTAGFLAWHRKYLLEYESALRSVDEKFKCVTLPYWDWTTETYGCKKRPSATSSLNAPGCDTYHAASQILTDFGGPGDPGQTKDNGANTHGSSGAGPVGCVTTGPFAGWVDHHGKCLSRGVNWKISDQKPFTGRIEMLKILGHTKYGNQYDREGFRVVLEGLPHGATHNYLGGHMRSFISPGDPIFFSHHAYIDKLWAVWQDCHDYDTLDVKTALVQEEHARETKKYYEHTRGYDKDGPNDVMPFLMQPNIELGGTGQCPNTGEQCSKDSDACAQCVYKQDSWCRSNTWDTTCCSLCTSGACASDCGAAVPPVVDFNEEGAGHLTDWIQSEKTPADVYSVKHLQQERSYLYAPDEIERSLRELAPEALGTCNLGKMTSLLSVEVREEVEGPHHTNTLRGHRARDYAQMVASSFKQAKCDMDKQSNSTSSFMEDGESQDAAQQQFQHAMKLAQEQECIKMAATGDYQHEYHCEADGPRYLLPWLGSKTWHQIMKRPSLARAVFCDPCCSADDSCLREEAVPAYH
jgi:tyrosinase